MNLKELITEDRAVSPVIGVILMVAITVILAAVIGTFVLGLGDSLQQQSPSASFGFDYADNASGTGYNATVTHEGGDSIEASQLNVTSPNWDSGWTDGDGTVSAGDSQILPDVVPGNDVRVIWTSNDGSSSQTIGSSTAPSS